MVTRCLAADLAKDGIVAISMHPGWVQTDMGGRHAAVTTQALMDGILDVVRQLNLEDNGKFFSYTGTEHPW